MRPFFAPLIRDRLIRLFLVTALVFYGWTLFALRLRPVEGLGLTFIDGLYRERHAALARSGRPPPPVVIAAIDDASLAALSARWPWDRSVFRLFLDRITPLGPSVVAFDLPFAVPSEDPAEDAAFAGALEAGPAVLSFYFGSDGKAVKPVGILERAAAATGFLNSPRDPDNVNRKTWPARRGGPDGPVFSFNLAASAVFLGRKPEDLLRSHYGISGAGAPGAFWTAYDTAAGEFETVPFWKFVRDGVPETAVRRRLVVVGVSSEIFHDMYDTPLGVMPGVALHANQIANYLGGVRIRTAEPPVFLTTLAAVTLAFAWIFYRAPAPAGALLLLAALFGAHRAAFAMFMRGWLIDYLAVAGALTLAFLTALIYRSVLLLVENRTLKYQSSRDGLTDLYTYRYLELKLKAEFDRARRAGEVVSFIIFDIDHFKRLNDRFGHEKGNDILVAFAKILKTYTRGEDLVARYGGEEFCVLLPKKSREEAFRIAERVRASLESMKFRFARKGETLSDEVCATVSAGICGSDSPDVFNGKELLRLADAALLRAKEGGRNRTYVHGDHRLS